MFRILLAVIALRVVDDRFLQPAAGVAPTDNFSAGSCRSRCWRSRRTSIRS